jgi:tetratricopeptide (TPR) repeat protein
MEARSLRQADDAPPPRVFLSYSHDSEEHSARVLALTQRLRRDGVDAHLDQFDPRPREGWPHWCARQILDADFVVLVCTATYRDRFFGYERPGIGRGVRWEAKIIKNILYRERQIELLPVIFDPDDQPFVPEIVDSEPFRLFGGFGPDDAAYAALLQELTDRRSLPPLPDLPPAPEMGRPESASVITAEVLGEMESVHGKLDAIAVEQRRQRRTISQGITLLVTIAALALWFVFRQEEVMIDLRVAIKQLQQQIEQTDRESLKAMSASHAPPQDYVEIDRWRHQALAGLAGAEDFIRSEISDSRPTIARNAVKLLQERGVNAALAFLDARLSAERQRRTKDGRELAQASLLKAYLLESVHDAVEQERAIRAAIAAAPDWWRPHNQLGLFFHNRADWPQAEEELEAAQKLAPPTAQPVVLNNLALLYKATKRFGEAEAPLKHGLTMAESSNPPDNNGIARLSSTLAALYLATNRLAEAELLLDRALKIDEKIYGPEHFVVARDLNSLALLYKATDRPTKAEALLQRALSIDEKSFGPENPDVARDINNLALLYQETNRMGEVEPLLQRALKIDEDNYGPDHPSVAIDLNNLAALYETTQRLNEAEPLLERALKIDETAYGGDHPRVAIDLNNLAQLYRAAGRTAEAAPLLERALKIDEKNLGPDHPAVADDLNNLATLDLTPDRLTEAAAQEKQAVIILLKSARATGHIVTNLKTFKDNYRIILGKMGKMTLAPAEISERIAAAGREAGYTDDQFAALLKEMGD